MGDNFDKEFEAIKSKNWKAVLDEMLRSESVAIFVQDVFSCIEKGILSPVNHPYGFGPMTYYGDYRTMLKDAVHPLLLSAYMGMEMGLMDSPFGEPMPVSWDEVEKGVLKALDEMSDREIERVVNDLRQK